VYVIQFSSPNTQLCVRDSIHKPEYTKGVQISGFVA